MKYAQKEMPPLLERYELKYYLIPDSMIGPISEFVSIYCSPGPAVVVQDDIGNRYSPLTSVAPIKGAEHICELPDYGPEI